MVEIISEGAVLIFKNPTIFNIINMLGRWDERLIDQASDITSHSAYAATETELYAAKIDGLLPPNFL